MNPVCNTHDVSACDVHAVRAGSSLAASVRARRLRVLMVSTSIAVASGAHASNSRELGDALSYALPAAVLGYELANGDREGVIGFASVFAVTTGSTEILKRVTRVERPDRSNRLSFPSGHAARAFSAASYVHRRYGFEYAIPAYALATYVGHTRVQAKRHRWGDVAGALAVSTAAAWWLIEPKQSKRVAVVPLYDREFVGLQVAAQFR